MFRIRGKCNKFTNEMHEITEPKILEDYYKLRGLPKEVFINHKLFFMPVIEETFVDEYNLYEMGIKDHGNRIMIPVKDVENNIMGFSGYSPVDKPKYMDSSTAYYNPKESCFFGMEIMRDVLEHNKKLFITEGIVDSLVLRYLGASAIAVSGANINKVVGTLMKHLNCCYIGDNDETGMRVIRDVHRWYSNCDCYVYKKIGNSKKVDTNDAYRVYGKLKLQAQILRIAYNREPEEILEKV